MSGWMLSIAFLVGASLGASLGILIFGLLLRGRKTRLRGALYALIAATYPYVSDPNIGAARGLAMQLLE